MTTSIEITNYAVAMERVAKALEKVETNTNRMTRSQGQTKTLMKDSQESMTQMVAAINQMSAGMFGLTRSMEQLSSSFFIAFGQLGRQLSNELAGTFDKLKTTSRVAGENAGKDFGKGLSAGIRSATAKVATSDYTQMLFKHLAPNAARFTNARFTPAGLTAAGKSELPLSMMPDLDELERQGAVLSKYHREQLAEWRKVHLDARKKASKELATLEKADADVALRQVNAAIAADLRAQNERYAEQKAARQQHEKDTLSGSKKAAKELAAQEKADADVALRQVNAAISADVRAQEEALKARLRSSASAATAMRNQAEKRNDLYAGSFSVFDPTGRSKTHGTISNPFQEMVKAGSVVADFSKMSEAATKAGTAMPFLQSKAEKAGSGIRQLSMNLKDFALHGDDAHSAARGLASGFGLLWLTWGRVAPLMAGAAVSNAFVQTIKQGAEINHTLETMRVLSDVTATDMARLNAQMLDMARNGPIGPQAIADGLKTLSLAGLNATDASYAIRDVINLAVAGDVDMKKAAEGLTGIATAFNYDARSFSLVADVIARTAAVSKASVESITEAMKTASVVHKEYGVTLNDMALGVALLNNLNISNTAGGTALRNFYVDLSGRSKQAQKSMKQMGFDIQKEGSEQVKDLLTLGMEFNKAIDALAKPAEKLRLRQLWLGERGGKLGVEVADSLRKPAQDQQKYAGKSRGEELQAAINEHYGMAARAAAELALTSKNQMQSVVSSYQAALVEAFKSSQPYILDVSTRLREIFQSSDFQSGLQKLVVGVGEVIHWMVRWADVLAIVGASWVALKLSLAVGGGFTAAAAGLQTMTIAALGLKTGLDAANLAKMTATERLTAVNTAMTAAAAGAGTFQAKVVSGVGAIATMMSRLSALVPIIGLAVTAWQLYDLFRGRAMEQAIDNNAENRSKAIVDNLTKETGAINDKIEALQKQISLEELLRRRGLSEALDANAARRAALQSKLQPRTGGASFAEPLSTDMVAGGLYDRNSAYAAAAELAALDASDAAIRKAQQVHAERAKVLEEETRKDAERRGKLAAAATGTGTQLLGGAATGNYVPSARKDTSSALGELSSIYADKRRLVEAELKAGLRSQADATAQSVRLYGEEYDAKVKAINEGTAQQLEALKKSDVKDPQAARKDILAGQAKALRDAARAEESRSNLAHLGNLAKYRTEVVDEYNKIVQGMDQYDAQLQEKAAPTLGLTAVEKASFDARQSYLKKYADELVRYNKVVDEARANERTWAGILADDENPQNWASWEAAIDNRIKAEENRNALRDRRTTGADAAARAAAKLQQQKEVDDLTVSTSDAILTAIVEGGRQGSVKLRNILQETLLIKPLRVQIEGIMTQVLGASGIGNALVSGLAGLFTGSSSSAASSTYSLTSGSLSSQGLKIPGRASGGWVAANTLHEVNEYGAEMFSVGGRDYLLSGSAQGHITPAHQISSPTSSPAQGASVVVNVIESPKQAGQQQRRSENGVEFLDVFVERIKSEIASDIVRDNGPIPNAMASTFGLNRGVSGA